MLYEVEYTDTFGGEANYSWCRRERFEAPERATDALIVRRAKRALGLTGRHRKEVWGECIVLHPAGECTIVFITYAGA